MDIVATIIFGIILTLALAYIIKEAQRRKIRNDTIETNYDIKVSIIFYTITTVLIVSFNAAYYLSEYLSPLAFFLTNLAFVVFPLISYGLARKRLIATQGKIEIYRLFSKKDVAIEDITKIKRTKLTSKIYVGNKVLISMDIRYYRNNEVFLLFVAEQAKCPEE